MIIVGENGLHMLSLFEAVFDVLISVIVCEKRFILAVTLLRACTRLL
jgi:hypothetical protein